MKDNGITGPKVLDQASAENAVEEHAALWREAKGGPLHWGEVSLGVAVVVCFLLTMFRPEGRDLLRDIIWVFPLLVLIGNRSSRQINAILMRIERLEANEKNRSAGKPL
jgi:hypothetical protein